MEWISRSIDDVEWQINVLSFYFRMGRHHQKVLSKQRHASVKSPNMTKYTSDLTSSGNELLQPKLHAAVMNNDLTLVTKLVKKKKYLKERNFDGATALTIAITAGRTDIVNCLLMAKADPNTTTYEGYTPLHFASYLGHSIIVNLLLESKAEKDVRTTEGFTPLLMACFAGYVDCVTQLLRAKASVTCDLADSATCLHVAVDQNMYEPISAMIKLGANPNARLFDGQTPLHFAVRKGFYKCATTLLKNDASPNCATKSGQTPLHMACSTGDIGMVRELLEAGADTTAKMCVYTERSDGAIQKQEMNGDCEGQSIISRSYMYSSRTKSIGRSFKDGGWTAMHFACYYNHINIVHLLHKSSGVSGLRLFSDSTSAGMTPLYLSAQNGHLEVVKFLVQHKSNVNVESNTGSVPIIVAAGGGHGDVVQILINNGANVNHTAQAGAASVSV